MGDIFKLIGDLGFPIAVAFAGGYFVYLTIKLLLQGVLGSIKGMAGIITALDNRVKTMNHDVIRIDTIVSRGEICKRIPGKCSRRINGKHGMMHNHNISKIGWTNRRLFGMTVICGEQA